MSPPDVASSALRKQDVRAFATFERSCRFPGILEPQDPNKPIGEEYACDTDRRDPVLSPIVADLHGMPPSLLITSTRDLLLSDTARFHRALLAAGVDSQLVVYEALPHAFWYHFELPETAEVLHLMAHFFEAKVGPPSTGSP